LGFLFRSGTAFDAIGVADTVGENRFRFAHTAGGMKGVELVDTTSPYASPIRVFDGTSVLAMRSMMRSPIGTTTIVSTFGAELAGCGRIVLASRGTIQQIHDHTSYSSIVATSAGAAVSCAVFRELEDQWYLLNRGYLKFSLTGIPANATILGANLSYWRPYVKAYKGIGKVEFNFTKQTHPGLLNSLTPFDWFQLTDTKLGADYEMVYGVDGHAMTFPFNSAGCAALIPNTRNAFAMRLLFDIAKTVPSTASLPIPIHAAHFLNVNSGSGLGTLPILSVTYSIPTYADTFVYTT
jgi:hypothetical protein